MLTGVSLLMRAVSVGFNVYVSNKIGSEGMGLFSLITGVYGFALTLATSGVNLAVTRLISECMSRNDRHRARKIMRCAAAYCLFFGGLASSLLWGFSLPIGAHLLDDLRTVRSLRIFAVSLPLMSLSSALNGYFTAVRRVYKNAIVGVLEQWCKIILISFLLNLLMPSGVEYACIALVLGGAVSEILSCLLMAILWLYEKNHRLYLDKASVKDRDVDDTVLFSVLGISLPVALSSYARSALLTVEHALIPKGLKKSGASHSASLAAYGKIQSMAFPIVLFPSAFLSSFSGLLVPELSESRERGNKRQITYIASRVFQFTLMFSIGVAGIFICFSDEISRVIYPNEDIAGYVSVFSALIPVMYLDSATDAMLKGLGYQVYSMNVNIIDSGLSVLLVWLLLPKYGIGGYIFTLFVTEILNAGLSVTKLLRETGLKVRLVGWICAPAACAAGACCIVRILREYLFFSNNVSELAVCILLTGAAYVVLLMMSYSLPPEDVMWFRNIFSREKGEASPKP